MSDITVIDDFLDKDAFNSLQSWYIKPPIDDSVQPCLWIADAITTGYGFQFVHSHDLFNTSFILEQNGFYKSLNPFVSLKAKCNITLKKEDQNISEKDWHNDVPGSEQHMNIKTAVLYINDNNGGTAFKTGEFVQSKANRLVEFPAEKIHAGVNTTDTDFRCVLNINYFPKNYFTRTQQNRYTT